MDTEDISHLPRRKMYAIWHNTYRNSVTVRVATIVFDGNIRRSYPPGRISYGELSQYVELSEVHTHIENALQRLEDYFKAQLRNSIGRVKWLQRLNTFPKINLLGETDPDLRDMLRCRYGDVLC